MNGSTANPVPAPFRRRPSIGRQVHAGHFRFLRAALQGEAIPAAWARELPEEGAIAPPPLAPNDSTDSASPTVSTDPKVHRLTAWLRSEMARAAARAGRPGTARLLRLELCPAALHAPTGTPARQARLLPRQLAALDWLEGECVRPVLVEDACSVWLPETLAMRLAVSGVTTLGQLIDRINGFGAGWTRGIPGLGSGKARAIEAFLAAHATTLTHRVGAHTTVPRRQRDTQDLVRVVTPATALVPLDKLIVPPALDGHDGRYRLPPAQCLLAARNDFEALLAWLRAKRGPAPALVARRGLADHPCPLDWLHDLSATQRAYRKEAERLLLWAILVRGKPLSSLAQEDAVAYREFLAAPPADWCGPRSRERWSPLWRPFEGPLSPRAQAYAVGVLGNLYRFLAEQNYLIGNPWHGVPVPRADRPAPDVGRSLTEAEWVCVREQLAALPPTSANVRLQCALALLYSTGLRLAEAVAATTDDLTWESLPLGPRARIEGWWLAVHGKGSQRRRVPMAPMVMKTIARYLKSRGFAADLGARQLPRGVALLGHALDLSERAPWAGRHVEAASGIAAGTLAGQLKAFFAQCADQLRETNPRSADRMAAASAHWLRHTHISHALARGAPLEVVQQNAGHASLATTTQYVHTEDARRMAVIQRLRLDD